MYMLISLLFLSLKKVKHEKAGHVTYKLWGKGISEVLKAILSRLKRPRHVAYQIKVRRVWEKLQG